MKDKKLLKKKLLIAVTLLLCLGTVALIIVITCAFRFPDNFDISSMVIFEKEAYILCGLCFLLVYHQIIRKTDNIGIKSKILKGFGTSALCTIQVILLNVLWQYIKFNTICDWKYPGNYLGFLFRDLTYTGRGNGFKYPMVFGLMLLAVLFDVFLYDKTIKFFETAENKKIYFEDHSDKTEKVISDDNNKKH